MSTKLKISHVSLLHKKFNLNTLNVGVALFHNNNNVALVVVLPVVLPVVVVVVVVAIVPLAEASVAALATAAVAVLNRF
jgi:hypothetical protein